MGEAAEMMLDGTVCGTCGCYMDGEADGFPRYCSDDCDPFHDEDTAPAQQRPKQRLGKTDDRRAQSIMDRTIAAIKLHGHSGWSKKDHKLFADRLYAVILDGLKYQPNQPRESDA